jgi:hypothetical protein
MLWYISLLMKENQPKAQLEKIRKSESFNDLEEKIEHFEKRIQMKHTIGFKVIEPQTYNVSDYKFKS